MNKTIISILSFIPLFVYLMSGIMKGQAEIMRGDAVIYSAIFTGFSMTVYFKYLTSNIQTRHYPFAIGAYIIFLIATMFSIMAFHTDTYVTSVTLKVSLFIFFTGIFNFILLLLSGIRFDEIIIRENNKEADHE